MINISGIRTQQYASCVEASKRVRWDIDRDVIRGRTFEMDRKLLPDSISGIQRFEFLDPQEARLLSQIQGRTYANMFGLVERFINCKVLELSQDHCAGDQVALVAAVEEILRIDDPFVSNRRVATRPVSLGGADMEEGDQVLLNWTSANRDSRVFGDPDRYDPHRNAPHNLVFGIGPHVCPGRALTLMELRVMLEELLARTSWIELAPDRPPVRETPPVGGWARVPIVLR